jgi:hypothetical protein
MPQPVPSTVEPTGWRAHWPAVALAVLAALVALWARHRLFPAYSWNRDEPVYLWHVDVLRSGRLTATDGGHPSLFQPWLSARGDGELFTQYTLGWPLVLLAADLLTGSSGSAPMLGAALAVLGTYALGLEVLRDRRVATLGAALMVASPILAIQGGAYLSYLFTLGLGLLAGSLLLSGVRVQRTLPVVAAGGLLGWIFLTRPYDALLWGAAFAVGALVRERARWARCARSLALCAAAALPLVLVTLAYNQRVTGDWLRFPITVADPMDTFGFGPKRLMPSFEVIDYDLFTAVKATAKNAFLLPWFLVGSYVGVALAGVGLWQRRREPATLTLVLVGAVFPVGYVVFWGNHLSSMAARISGPIYFVPVYAPVCLLIASALVRWWPDRPRAVRLIVVVMAVITVPLAVNRFQVNRDISLQQAPWRASVAAVQGRGLVFVADTAPYLLYLNPFASNGPDLDDRILYASDGDPAMLDLIAEMPDRTPYLQQASVPAQEAGPRENPAAVDVSLVPVEVRRGGALTLAITVQRPDPTRSLRLDVSTGAATQTLDIAPDGTTRPVAREVTVVPPGAEGGLELAPRGTISIALAQGGEGAEPTLLTEILYRVVDGRAEALLPVTLRHVVLVDGDPQWRRAVDLPQLRVEVRARPSAP